MKTDGLDASRQRCCALVTRPREEVATLVEALAARGVGALVEPVMQIHFRDAAPNLRGVQALLCTSANGVRALSRATRERAIPLFAVGEATARRARVEGFASVESAGGNSRDLARLVANRLRPADGRLVHVCGAEVAGDLVGKLRGRGFSIERETLYEARPVSALSAETIAALVAGEIDFALFFSPRTAAIFTGLAHSGGVAMACARVVALSISVAADAALGSATWRERRVAQRPDQPALLDLLDNVLAEWRRG